MTNISGWFELYSPHYTMSVFSDFSLKAPDIQGQQGQFKVKQLRFNNNGDKGRPRYIILVTSLEHPIDINELAIELERTLNITFESLMNAQNKSSVQKEINQVRDVCREIEKSYVSHENTSPLPTQKQELSKNLTANTEGCETELSVNTDEYELSEEVPQKKENPNKQLIMIAVCCVVAFTSLSVSIYTKSETKLMISALNTVQIDTIKEYNENLNLISEYRAESKNQMDELSTIKAGIDGANTLLLNQIETGSDLKKELALLLKTLSEDKTLEKLTKQIQSADEKILELEKVKRQLEVLNEKRPKQITFNQRVKRAQIIISMSKYKYKGRASTDGLWGNKTKEGLVNFLSARKQSITKHYLYKLDKMTLLKLFEQELMI